VFSVVALSVLLWAVPLWFALTWAVFCTGYKAFGPGAGIGYAVLVLVLTVFFGAGVYAVPLMVRADIRQLIDQSLGGEKGLPTIIK